MRLRKNRMLRVLASWLPKMVAESCILVEVRDRLQDRNREAGSVRLPIGSVHCDRRRHVVSRWCMSPMFTNSTHANAVVACASCGDMRVVRHNR